MREKHVRAWTVFFCVATIVCMLSNKNLGRADSGGQALFALYPTGEDSLAAWLLPEEKTQYAMFLPAETEAEAEAGQEDTYTTAGEVHVLIYHTHTTEAYRMDGTDVYEESGFARTRNSEQNVVRVGEALKDQLEAKGFRVIHDVTDHEPPKLATAYTRSEQTMRYYQQQYPDIDIFIDLHRDAADVEKSKDDVVLIDGKRCARMMFVVGKGSKYTDKPDFAANYGLAEALSKQLDTYHPKLTRNIRVKEGRYNQHVADMCLLVEVGHNANTLQDALNSIPYLAEAMAQVVTIVD